MDMSSLIMNLIANLGLPGLVAVMWWVDNKKTLRTTRERDRFQTLVDQYAQLVVDGQRTRDLQHQEFMEHVRESQRVFFNVIQSQARIEEKILTNQYCPLLRQNTRREGT